MQLSLTSCSPALGEKCELPSSAMLPVFPSLSVSLHVRHTISIQTSLDEQVDLGLEWLLAKALMTSTF